MFQCLNVMLFGLDIGLSCNESLVAMVTKLQHYSLENPLGNVFFLITIYTWFTFQLWMSNISEVLDVSLYKMLV